MSAAKRVHPASSHSYGDWNYRLFKHDNGEIEIVEVIYDKDGISWCEMFPLRAESDSGLREIVNNWVMAAFDKPVLDRTSFGTEHCCEEHVVVGDLTEEYLQMRDAMQKEEFSDRG